MQASSIYAAAHTSDISCLYGTGSQIHVENIQEYYNARSVETNSGTYRLHRTPFSYTDSIVQIQIIRIQFLGGYFLGLLFGIGLGFGTRRNPNPPPNIT